MRTYLHLSLFLIVAFSSCVYTFSGGFPAKYRNVYLKSLENNSQRQDVTLSIQNYLFQEIQKDGRLNIVSENRARLQIIPKLIDFGKRASEFTETGEVTVYTIILKAKILVRPMGDTALFLRDTVFSGRGVYNVSSENEDAGVRRAVKDLVNNFLNKLFEVRI